MIAAALLLVLSGAAAASAAGVERRALSPPTSLFRRAESPPLHQPQNHLAESKSRYLQQHARNPVEWYPWGDAAFERARRENKPIFLSIGYSTCHWCHVMAQESFADEEIAKLMNEAFVSIKVDREERPDLDAVYLAVTRTLTGDAGWPNTKGPPPDARQDGVRHDHGNDA